MTIKKTKLLQNTSSFAFDFINLTKAVTTFFSNLVRTRIFNSDAKRGPLFISWLCTYRCNADCLFCNASEMNKLHPETLSLERSLEIAHQIGRAKTWVVGFTGGEVLLWPYLFDVIHVLKQYGVNVYIITNGMLLKQNVEKIIDAKVDAVVVSIDSLDPQEHDYNRRRKGLYDFLIEGIKYLKEKRKGEKPLIKSMSIFSRRSYLNIEETITQLLKIVDVASIQPIVSDYVNSPHGIKKEEITSFFPEVEEESAIKNALGRLIKKFSFFNNFYFKNIPTYWFHPERLLKIKCWAPFLRLLIMPDGNVVHCAANSKYSSVGNLKDMTLMEVWNGPEIKRHREELRRGENNCICWSQDVSFNAFLYSLSLMNRLPVFKKHFR
jgi:MoaA/NifB/PqqE/SkfB family radical SAM enzyme